MHFQSTLRHQGIYNRPAWPNPKSISHLRAEWVSMRLLRYQCLRTITCRAHLATDSLLVILQSAIVDRFIVAAVIVVLRIPPSLTRTFSTSTGTIVRNNPRSSRIIMIGPPPDLILERFKVVIIVIVVLHQGPYLAITAASATTGIIPQQSIFQRTRRSRKLLMLLFTLMMLLAVLLIGLIDFRGLVWRWIEAQTGRAPLSSLPSSLPSSPSLCLCRWHLGHVEMTSHPSASSTANRTSECTTQ